MAASAVFLIITLDRFIPGVASDTPLLAIPIPLTSIAVTFSIHTLAASAAIIVAALIHIRGVGPGRIVSNVLTTLKIVSLVVFIGFGLTAGTGSPSNLPTAGPVTTTGFLFALIPVMFTYSGWNAAAYMAEEIRDPGRNVPRALLMGTAAVIAIYLLMNVLYLFVFPIGELGTLGGKERRWTSSAIVCSASAAGDIMAHRRHLSLAAGINAMDVRRTARLFRDGARQRILQERCAGAPEVQDARRRRSSRRRRWRSCWS